MTQNPLSFFDSLGLDKMSPSDVLMLILKNNRSSQTAELILCIAYKESTLDPAKKNPAPGSTAWGLMGVTSAATKDMGINHNDMTDAESNIAAGTQYLNRRITWKKPFGAGGDVSGGLSRYGEGEKYAKSILECENCLRKDNACTHDSGMLKCLKPLHGGK